MSEKLLATIFQATTDENEQLRFLRYAGFPSSTHAVCAGFEFFCAVLQHNLNVRIVHSINHHAFEVYCGPGLKIDRNPHNKKDKISRVPVDLEFSKEDLDRIEELYQKGFGKTIDDIVARVIFSFSEAVRHHLKGWYTGALDSLGRYNLVQIKDLIPDSGRPISHLC